MANEIENAVTKKAADVLVQYIDSIIQSLRGSVDRKIMKYFQGFSDYIEITSEKCSRVRVMIDREKVYNLDEIYVKANFTCGSGLYDDDDIHSDLINQKRIVVQGFGGIGKTILMKYMWLKTLKSGVGRIPVFIELRKLNDLQAKNIGTFIRTTISASNEVISESIFNELMRDGKFVFILDGFDEISDEHKRSIEIQIIEMSVINVKCGFIVSSRKDDRFTGWSNFKIYTASNFNIYQIREIISKIDFDKNRKSKFVSSVIDANFSKYNSFLSNPILALIMLFTFDQFAEIPEKAYIFYRYAFQTLYSLHDASKDGVYHRPRKTGLNEDDFAKAFAFFCLHSYVNRRFSFNKEQIIETIEKSKLRSGIKFDTEKFLLEACESVNLLYMEGDNYSFTHRSFQEYFTAFAVTRYMSNSMLKLVPKINRGLAENVLSMMYEMNSDAVEDEYIVKKYEILKQGIDILCRKELVIEDFISKIGFRVTFLFDAITNSRKINWSFYPESEEFRFISELRCFYAGSNVFKDQLILHLNVSLACSPKIIESFGKKVEKGSIIVINLEDGSITMFNPVETTNKNFKLVERKGEMQNLDNINLTNIVSEIKSNPNFLKFYSKIRDNAILIRRLSKSAFEKSKARKEMDDLF